VAVVVPSLEQDQIDVVRERAPSWEGEFEHPVDAACTTRDQLWDPEAGHVAHRQGIGRHLEVVDRRPGVGGRERPDLRGVELIQFPHPWQGVQVFGAGDDPVAVSVSVRVADPGQRVATLIFELTAEHGSGGRGRRDHWRRDQGGHGGDEAAARPSGVEAHAGVGGGRGLVAGVE
jgi:hypothetical protein